MPLSLGLAHQFGAVVVFALAVSNAALIYAAAQRETSAKEAAALPQPAE